MADATGIIKRTDYAAYSERIQSICLFCSHCDPEGKGGNGGIIYATEFDFDHAVEKRTENTAFLSDMRAQH